MLAVFIISGLAGWLAGTQVRSPAEVAARTAPPPPSPILVPAENRELTTTVVTRGTARFGSPQKLLLPPSALRPGPAVVGRPPLLGTELKEGEQLLSASGRPVFLLQGVQPSFRDLGPGLSGEDVFQLEEALARLGVDPGRVDGVYDRQTEAAVERWYRAAGYEPFQATQEQLTQIRQLELEMAAHRVELLGAQGQRATAAADLVAAQTSQSSLTASALRAPDQFALAAAEAEAQRGLAAAEVAAREAAVAALKAPPKTTPSTATEISAAQADVNAKQSLAHAQQSGTDALNVAIAGGDPLAISVAQANLDAAMAAGSTELTAKQRNLDKVREGTPGTVATPAEIATAERELATAKANQEVVRLSTTRLLNDAQAAAALARSEASKAAAAVQSAEAAIASSSAAADVRARSVSAVASELDNARRRAGIQVPANEILFLQSVPVRVAEVGVIRGQEASGVFMTVTDSTVAIDGSLPIESFSLIKQGMTVAIDEPQLGIKAEGVVRRIAPAPGTDGVDAFHVYFEVVVDRAPPSLVGASVRLTIAIERSGGNVLAVPVSALSLAPDGSTRVQRSDASGTLTAVKVTAGLSASGYVHVTPVEGTLRAGDLVVVGFEQRTAGKQ
ncbi:MAG: peptidoglycan-binding domain-containing protein [Dehalococcoidia bacterium]